MPSVTVEQGEPIDRALKRFKKECQKSGLQAELRRREFYEKPSVKRKRKIEAAKRKARRRMMKLKRKLDRF
ncbi:MAG TPA: 30S ribosomal protein S21 [Candidatus Sumerlaeota bacterium]|nr:30S ribosomal protein S21 [Candidatus Sumerlaeota bacterium]